MARKLSKQLLSGSTGGRPIKVVATATPGTTIHATGTSASIVDELWLWAQNSDSADRTLTIEFGGVTDPDDLIVNTLTIPARAGLQIVVPGIPLVGTGAAARTVSAFASAANVVTVSGYVNRLT